MEWVLTLGEPTIPWVQIEMLFVNYSLDATLQLDLIIKQHSINHPGPAVVGCHHVVVLVGRERHCPTEGRIFVHGSQRKCLRRGDRFVILAGLGPFASTLPLPLGSLLLGIRCSISATGLIRHHHSTPIKDHDPKNPPVHRRLQYRCRRLRLRGGAQRLGELLGLRRADHPDGGPEAAVHHFQLVLRDVLQGTVEPGDLHLPSFRVHPILVLGLLSLGDAVGRAVDTAQGGAVYSPHTIIRQDPAEPEA
mmetsp:Transcript_57595/g.153858  ORF Transcript_57595/g.153858 Transcript_57595/m.153858 type:complete len:249 (-) Transcript_57595:48-794(-)